MHLKYNTDTGAFGYGKAYAVKRNDDEGHSGYMEEFYDGAIKLYDEHKVGEVLPEIVVTDYGVCRSYSLHQREQRFHVVAKRTYNLLQRKARHC